MLDVTAKKCCLQNRGILNLIQNAMHLQIRSEPYIETNWIPI